jgi:hypothetical protein
VLDDEGGAAYERPLVSRWTCEPTALTIASKAPFGGFWLKFNSHYINVFLSIWSNKCKLITCMSVQVRSNLRDESIKPN